MYVCMYVCIYICMCIWVKNHKEWFDDYDPTINQLLKTNHALHEKFLSQSHSNEPATENTYKEHRATL